MVVKELLDYGQKALKDISSNESLNEIYILLSHALKVNKTFLITHQNDLVSREVVFLYEQMIEQRKNHKPIAYILNKAYFMNLELYVKEGVLIPRADSEIIIEQLLEKEVKNKVLDLCCGSGVLGITYASCFEDAHVDLVDISDICIEVSTKNTILCGVSERVNVIKSDLFDNLNNKKYELIISNPPYIKSDEINTLMSDVKLYEPHLALDGGEDGMLFYRKIIKQAKNHLSNNGMLVLEIGINQEKEVSLLLEENGYRDIEQYCDYNQIIRTVFATI